jgi:hypothetical protein
LSFGLVSQRLDETGTEDHVDLGESLIKGFEDNVDLANNNHIIVLHDSELDSGPLLLDIFELDEQLMLLRCLSRDGDNLLLELTNVQVE